MTNGPDKDRIKKAKMDWYKQKRCVDSYYSDRFASPLGEIRDAVEKDIVLKYTGGLVLDGGCGPGRFALAIAASKPGSTVIGLDSSADMLAYGKREAGEKGQGNIAFAGGDLEFLPFRDNTFDSVASVHVLFHLPQYEKIVKEFLRVLKPGGMLAVEFSSSSHQRLLKRTPIKRAMWRIFGKVRVERKNKTPVQPDRPELDYYSSTTPEECREILAKYGGEYMGKITYDFPNSIWFTNGLLGSGRFISRLLALRPAFSAVRAFENNISRYLPASWSPRFFLLGKKA